MSDDINLDEVNQTDSPSEKTPSEIPNEWNTLAGKTQERIRELARLKNEALERAERAEAQLKTVNQPSNPVPMPQVQNMTEDEKRALDRLKVLGLDPAVKGEVESLKAELEQIKQQESTRLLDQEHNRLEKQYAGEDHPVYDRREIEQFMSAHGIYDPEAAYLKLYKDEFFSSKPSSKPMTPPMRTKSRIASEDVWTPERLQERLRRPDGTEFFLKNENKIDALTKKWAKEGVVI